MLKIASLFFISTIFSCSVFALSKSQNLYFNSDLKSKDERLRVSLCHSKYSECLPIKNQVEQLEYIDLFPEASSIVLIEKIKTKKTGGYEVEKEHFKLIDLNDYDMLVEFNDKSQVLFKLN